MYSCGIYAGNLFFVTPAVILLKLMIFKAAEPLGKYSRTNKIIGSNRN